MSTNPFAADPEIPARLSAITAATRDAIRSTAFAELGTSPQANNGGVLPATVANDLVARFGLHSTRDLMCLLLDTAQHFAEPAISDFHVGAIGQEAASGNLILGGNVEFPGTHLGYTLHGEGFVFTRAMSRGTDIASIAIGEAHPCAHCRQYLSEYAASAQLELFDPLGHTLTMAQLYPWPFDPAYLGESGAVPGRRAWAGLHYEDAYVADATETLLEAGRRSHAPYSKCPGALLLHLLDGSLVTGLAIESVAFNPTIHPLQAAVVDLLAHGRSYDDIAAATLGTVRGGAVDYAASTRELLARIAPRASLTVLGWAP